MCVHHTRLSTSDTAPYKFGKVRQNMRPVSCRFLLVVALSSHLCRRAVTMKTIQSNNQHPTTIPSISECAQRAIPASSMSSSSASQKHLQQEEEPLPPAKKKPKRPKVRCVATCFRFSPTFMVWKAKGRQNHDATHTSCVGNCFCVICVGMQHELCSFPSRSRVDKA